MQVGDLLQPRDMGDVLAQVVRVRLGGTEHVLPVLSIDANERWKGQLDVLWSALFRSLDTDDTDHVFATLAADPQPFIELLGSYDRNGVLPSSSVIRTTATELDVLVAILEVWRAANPKVDIALAAMDIRRTSLGPMSSLLPSTAGTPPPSGVN